VKRKFGFSFLIVLVLLLTQLGSAFADGNSKYLADVSHQKYTTLGDQWWHYAFSLPEVDFNQFLTSASGECVHTNQTSELFFLSGFWGAGSATRTCTVKAGTLLFFPLINSAWAEQTKYYDRTATPAYVPSNFIKWFDQVFSPANGTTAFADLDNSHLVTQKNQDRFYVTSNSQKAPIYIWPTWVGGSPSINYQTFNGGYYVALKLPPRAEPYKLHFGGAVINALSFTTHFGPNSQWVKDGFPSDYTVPFGAFSQDITYTIKVTR
jgi:hypothetical protein